MEQKIQHPENEDLIIIRQWQVDACGNDGCAAALLNQLEYWHNFKLRSFPQNGLSSSMQPLQWHRIADLQDKLLIFGERRIREAIKRLQELNFITTHRNPNPRYKFDNTKFFLLNVDAINRWIKQYQLDNSPYGVAKTNTQDDCFHYNDYCPSDKGAAENAV